MGRTVRLPSLRTAVATALGCAAAVALLPVAADPGAATPLPTPRVQVMVQGADDVEHYVARQVGMGYFDAAAAAKRPIAPGRATDIEVWLTPNESTRFRAWVDTGAASFAVTCPPDQCHTPYDLGKRVATEIATRQSDLRSTDVARGK